MKIQIKKFLYFMYSIVFGIKRKNNKIDFKLGKGTLLTSCYCSCIGNNNIIVIGDSCRLRRCNFIIHGNNNKIFIKDLVNLNGSEFWIENNNNVIEIGERTSVTDKTQFAALEGTKIKVGSDCMFAKEIYLRTSDSHPIYNCNGVRINLAKDIIIGNHVWIGMQALLLKGCFIADNCIVGARATVTHRFELPNTLIAGTPAKIIKKDVSWKTSEGKK